MIWDKDDVEIDLIIDEKLHKPWLDLVISRLPPHKIATLFGSRSCWKEHALFTAHGIPVLAMCS
jgi:hypothetical protein